MRLAASPASFLRAWGPRPGPPLLASPWSLLEFSFALLQLLWRSAADIVREDTDWEMATFLMVPLAPPDPYVQALFFELDSISLAVAVCGRNCGQTTRMGQRGFEFL